MPCVHTYVGIGGDFLCEFRKFLRTYVSPRHKCRFLSFTRSFYMCPRIIIVCAAQSGRRFIARWIIYCTYYHCCKPIYLSWRWSRVFARFIIIIICMHARRCASVILRTYIAVVVDAPKCIKIRYDVDYNIISTVIENSKMTSACAAEKARGLNLWWWCSSRACALIIYY